jgi:hypothetical protein
VVHQQLCKGDHRCERRLGRLLGERVPETALERRGTLDGGDG